LLTFLNSWEASYTDENGNKDITKICFYWFRGVDRRNHHEIIVSLLLVGKSRLKLINLSENHDTVDTPSAFVRHAIVSFPVPEGIINFSPENFRPNHHFLKCSYQLSFGTLPHAKRGLNYRFIGTPQKSPFELRFLSVVNQLTFSFLGKSCDISRKVTRFFFLFIPTNRNNRGWRVRGGRIKETGTIIQANEFYNLTLIASF
jgi:hypothetical protein